MVRLKIIVIFMAFIYTISGQDYSDDASTTEIFEETTTQLESRNKTLSELVQEQTDAIKKIISKHKPPNQDYPVVTRKDAEIKDAAVIKADKEKQSIEELRFKCQHYFQLLQEGKLHKTTTEKPKATVIPFGPALKPEFLRFKPKFPQPPPPRNKPTNFFIFTQNSGPRTNKLADKLEAAASAVVEDKIAINSTETSQQSTTEAVEKLKYVKLEPLILQKTLLTNGKTLFYWYRTIPTTHQGFVQIPDTPENANVNTVAQPQSHEQNIPLPEQYQFYVDPQTGSIMRNSKPTTTTPQPTTTQAAISTQPPPPVYYQQTKPQFFINPQTGLIYQNALPHQFIYHHRAQDISTTSTTTTTTPKPETTTPEGPKVPTYTVEYTEPQQKYKHELKFVIPMLVTGNSELSKFPYQLDPYAYLPKNQQPDLMNIAVPYIPNYHMIRTLTVPKKE